MSEPLISHSQLTGSVPPMETAIFVCPRVAEAGSAHGD